LETEIKDRQKQIHRYYVSEFNRFAGPCKEEESPAKAFKKVFPKPEPKPEDAEKFARFYKMYEEWVTAEFNGDGEDDDDGGILASTVGGESTFSSMGVSANL